MNPRAHGLNQCTTLASNAEEKTNHSCSHPACNRNRWLQALELKVGTVALHAPFTATVTSWGMFLLAVFSICANDTTAEWGLQLSFLTAAITWPHCFCLADAGFPISGLAASSDTGFRYLCFTSWSVGCCFSDVFKTIFRTKELGQWHKYCACKWLFLF